MLLDFREMFQCSSWQNFLVQSPAVLHTNFMTMGKLNFQQPNILSVTGDKGSTHSEGKTN